MVEDSLDASLTEAKEILDDPMVAFASCISARETLSLAALVTIAALRFTTSMADAAEAFAALIPFNADILASSIC